MKPPCALCLQPYHRYGTSDKEHTPTPYGCINTLLYNLEQTEKQLAFTRDILSIQRDLNKREYERRVAAEAEVERLKETKGNYTT